MNQHTLHRLIAPFVYGERLAIVPRRLQPMWAERRFIARFLKRLRIDAVIDAGANVGQYALELRALGFRKPIFSFEPDPQCFAALEAASRSDPFWHAFNFALGREEATLTMNIMAKSTYNSFHEPSTEETDADAANNHVVDRVDVPIRRLDEVLPVEPSAAEITRFHLKMDTQGHDLEVFAGALGVLDRIRSLQSEVAIKRIYAHLTPWTESIARYQDAGFDLAALHPVNPHRDELSEMDCFMVNRSLG